MSLTRSFVRVVLVAASLPALASAQGRDSGTRHILSIGGHPRVDGIRINFRDRELDRVRGANITVWSAYDDADLGEVRGLALGLPLTSAGDLTGIGLGVAGLAVEGDSRGFAIGGLGVGAGGSLRGFSAGGLGVGAGGDVRGIALGGLGIGSGGDIRGIAVGGLGAGGGGDVRGAAIGGLGVGVGGNARGLMIGGLGAAAGRDLRGAAIGGIGVAAGDDVRGLLVGGIGVGAGGSLSGIAVGGVGVGSGGDVHGLMIGGVGVGSGGEMVGIAIGGVGVGAGDRIHGGAVGLIGVGSPRIEGVAIGAHVRSEDVLGVVIAPAWFRAHPGADVVGLAVSTVNVVEGRQHGLAIGVVNYAHTLRGVQLGLVNIIRDNPSGRRWLPIVNWGNER